MTLTTNTKKDGDDFPADLMDQLYGILDSKIQYEEFRINQAVKSYVDIEPYFPGQDELQPGHPFAKLMENNARVLENIDKAGRKIKLFFTIRKKLNHENAQMVLKKISDGSFESFTPAQLNKYFDQPWARKEIA